MNIEVVDHAGKKVIVISGDIDMYSSPVLREKLMGFIKGKTPALYIDFKDVSYIDSSGIATFVEGLKGMMTYSGKMKLFGVPQKIVEIFNFSKLDKVFEIYGNMDDAINS